MVPSASPTKLATVFGASCSKNLTVKLPSVVANRAYVPALSIRSSYRRQVSNRRLFPRPRQGEYNGQVCRDAATQEVAMTRWFFRLATALLVLFGLVVAPVFAQESTGKAG